MSKELAKYGIKNVTNLATAEELPVSARPAIKNGASLFSGDRPANSRALAVIWPQISTLAIDLYVGWMFLISGLIGLFSMFVASSPYDAFVAHLGQGRKGAFARYLVLLLPTIRKEGEVGRDVMHKRDVQTIHAESLETIFDRAAHAVGRVVEHDAPAWRQATKYAGGARFWKAQSSFFKMNSIVRRSGLKSLISRGKFGVTKLIST